MKFSKLLPLGHIIVVIVLTTYIGGLAEFDPSGNFISAGSNMADYVIAAFMFAIMLVFLVVALLGIIAVCLRMCFCLIILVPITFSSSIILF